MKLEARVARMVIRSQPQTICKRLLKHEELVAFAALAGGRYPGLGSFKHEAVVAALANARQSNGVAAVANEDGRQFALERSADQVRLTPLDGEASVTVTEFQFLDPDPDVRLRALDEVEEVCQPSFPSPARWRAILQDRPLTENEITLLITEIRQSPSQVLISIEQKWRSGKIDARDLFPSCRAYFEGLVPLGRPGQTAEEYIRDVLRPSLTRTIERSLTLGLRYSLPTNVDPRISVGTLFDQVPPKQLLETMPSVGDMVTPHALLGMLEVALQHYDSDQGFRDIASGAVERLARGSLETVSGTDIYRLLPPLVRACLRHISVEEEFSGTPPYWRRLAAFAHAGLLLEILTTRKVDSASFTNWCDAYLTPGMVAAELVDMQQEPLWLADDLAPFTLRATTLGRLKALGLYAADHGIELPNWADAEAAIEELVDQGAVLFTALAGPMEGSPRISNIADVATSEVEPIQEAFAQIASSLREDPAGPAWNGLARSSRVIRLDANILGAVEKAVRAISFPQEEPGNEKCFDALASASVVAAVQPHEPLADAVAACLVQEAHKFAAAHEAEIGYRILMMAAAAFADRERWLEWLARWMAEYAYNLPKGESCAQLASSLEILQALMPLADRRLGRARKLATAALI